MDRFSANINDYVRFVTNELLDQKEAILISQFNNLVKDGILQIEKTSPVLVERNDPSDPLGRKVELKQAVKLTFNAERVLKQKDTEIENLKAKIAYLEDRVVRIKNITEEKQ